MDDAASIQEEMNLDQILDELRQSDIDTPRIHILYKFTSINTEIHIFDKFVAVREGEDDDTEYPIVALGQAPQGELGVGDLQLVDHRVLTHLSNFDEGVKIFEGLVEPSPPFIQTVEGIHGIDKVVKYILDTWKLAGEMEKATIH